MAQPKPDKAIVWPLVLACGLVALASLILGLVAILVGSWKLFGATVIGFAFVVHPLWGELVNRIIGNQESVS